MKKLLFSLVVFLLVCSAIEARDNSWGTMGGIGMEKLWKSSDTCNNINTGKISTGTIVIRSVEISSVGINSGIRFLQYTSTVDLNTSNEWVNVYSTYPNQGTIQLTTSSLSNSAYIMQRSTMGWAFTTVGNPPSCIRILWDYLDAPNR